MHYSGVASERKGQTENRENYDDGRNKSTSVGTFLVIDIP
jgi:hypothetical protein